MVEVETAGVHITRSDLQRLSADGGAATITDNRIGNLGVSGSHNLVVGNVIDSFAVHGFEGDVVRSNDIDALRVTSTGALIEDNTFSHRVAGEATTAITVTNPLLLEVSDVTIRRNHISNYQTGVSVASMYPLLPAPTGVTITQNDISNVTIPIDLDADGVTPNDPAPDADTGGNCRQNFPVLTSAVAGLSQLTVMGTLSSVPSTSYRIELFASPTSAPST